jgi:hypothetical protein
VLARVEGEVVVDAERVEEGARLEDEGDAHPVPRRLKRGVQAVDGHRAGGRRLQAGDVAQEHALARAARPHDDEDLARPTSKLTFFSTDEVPELLRQPRDLDAHGVGLGAGEGIAGLAAAGLDRFGVHRGGYVRSFVTK